MRGFNACLAGMAFFFACLLSNQVLADSGVAKPLPTKSEKTATLQSIPLGAEETQQYLHLCKVRGIGG